jgi:hypothetical protein
VRCVHYTQALGSRMSPAPIKPNQATTALIPKLVVRAITLLFEGEPAGPWCGTAALCLVAVLRWLVPWEILLHLEVGTEGGKSPSGPALEVS